MDRPTITTDCGANISKGVEQHGLWDWSRCICHIIHNSVNGGLLEIEDTLQVMKRLSTWMHRSSNAWRAFCQVQRLVHKEGRGIRRQTACISADESLDLGSPSEDGTKSEASLDVRPKLPKKGTRFRVLHLVKPMPTRWNSTYFCIQRAMRLREAITIFLRDHGHTIAHNTGNDSDDEDCTTDDMHITEGDWVDLKEVLEGLGPLKEFSKNCKSNSTCAISSML